MEMNRVLRRFAVVTVFLFAFACGEDDFVPIVPEVYESSELVTSKSQAEIQSFIKARNLPIPPEEIQSGVDIYKVVYKTHFNGGEILASGLVLLPQTKGPHGMLSFQHGTIIAHSEAPSETSPTSDIMLFYASIAGPGFIGVVPDFIGFGSSKDILHPYYLEEPTATAVIDNVRAARELALINRLEFNGKLFLAGYSQGGYATMAAHKSIEEDGLENFNLIASFPSSGGYDIKGVQEFFFQQTTYDQPFYIAFVAMSYKTHLQWSTPLSDLFKAPYAEKIPGLFNGQFSSGNINSQLTTSIQDLITTDMLNNINTDAKFSHINDAFSENSLTDWVPKTRMYMFHGDLDITVPYENSVAVYNEFIKNGASKDIVTFTTLPYATHGSGVTPYLIQLINQVLVLK